MATKATVALTVRVTEALAKKIRKQAEREGQTVNAFIIGVLKMDNLLLSEKEWKLRLREEEEWRRRHEEEQHAKNESLEKRVSELEASLRTQVQ